MFIGHYGPALAAKSIEKRLPLGLLFLAVQWLDVVWSGLVMLGVEKLRITPGLTQASALDLYYMPYTHSLLGALALSGALGAVVALLYRTRRGAVWAVVAGAVFSHWVLDLVVHIPDMPLIGDTMKVGLGLWKNVWVSCPLEIALLWAGTLLYVRAVPSRRRMGNTWLWTYVTILSAVEIYASFGPPPASDLDEARTAITLYLVLALLAGLVDWARGTATMPGSTARLRLNPAQ